MFSSIEFFRNSIEFRTCSATPVVLIHPNTLKNMKQLYPIVLTRRITLFFLLLISFLSASSQTTPVEGITTFNTIPNWNYFEYAYTNNGSSGFLAADVEGSGWDIRGFTSGPDGYVIAGENWASSSDGGFVYLALMGGGATISSMRFKPNDGKLFDLNAIDMGYDVMGANISFTITGYRNNVSVPGAQYFVSSFASFGNGGNWRTAIPVSTNANFIGIDEFRITPNSGGLVALDIDNIHAVNFRNASFAQITPGDIPPFNYGAFTKTIAGHDFLFTPAFDNWVDYNNDVGSGTFGGLYAYDYNTFDGTEETITPPSGYTFDLKAFQYISDRGPVNLTVTLTFQDNSTDTKNYVLNGNSNVQTFSGFTTAANDIKKVRIVSDALVYYNNFELDDIKTYIILPLRWIRFTAAKQGDDVKLTWRTAAEQGTNDFVVEHSPNGQQWNIIGTVNAAGTNGAEHDYSFLHTAPVKGMNAYRILQRDIDGRSSYSPAVSISLTAPEKIQVYPNPVVNGTLQVKLSSPELVQVFNGAGLLVLERKLPEGVSALNINHLAKGIYTVKVKENSMVVVVQ